MRKQPRRAAKKRTDEPKKHVIVTVSRVPGEPGECRIEPQVARVLYGGTVKFAAVAGGLVVFLPTPGKPYVPFRSLKKRPFFAVGAEGKKLMVLKSRARKPRERVYVYAVYSKKLKTFAHASLPKMIIGPNSA
ncbi:MAG TPA: hypothetical protein VMT45_12785 [Thermoanaerobaculaceae bacterium]|nr:hypothetical protein [Thermoanaerobaculaceae bacterium]